MFIGQCQYPFCRFLHAEPKLCCQLLHGIFRGGHIQCQGAAQGEIRLQTAEHYIGVGDRDPVTATSITGWPRVGASGMRPHVEQARIIHIGQ